MRNGPQPGTRALTRAQAEAVRRNRHGWSQRQWARFHGVSQGTIARIMTGETYREPEGRPRMPQTKLTADDVRAIRSNREGLTDAARAARLGVHPNVVFRVRAYQTHLEVLL